VPPATARCPMRGVRPTPNSRPVKLTPTGSASTSPVAADVTKPYDLTTLPLRDALPIADITAGFVNLQTGTLTEGSHTLTTTVTDAASSVSIASNSITVIEDAMLPAAQTITPMTADVLPLTATYTTSGVTTNDTHLTVKL